MMTLILLAGFFCIFLLVALAVGMLCLRPASRLGATTETAWFSFFTVALVLFRFPFLRSNIELNHDEGQMLVQAVRFSTDWLPWRSVDGTTGGPLNSYIQAWPMLLGIFPDYRTARVTGALLIVASVFFMHVGLRLVLSPALSLVILNACALFYCLAAEPNFVHCSSEHLPTALCALAYSLSVLAARTNSRIAYFMIGLALGAMPFTKIQTAPIAVVLAAVVTWQLAFRPGEVDKRRRVDFIALGVGLLSMPTIVLVPVIAAGYWRDFVIRYILFALNYGPATPVNHLMTLARLLRYGGSATAFLFSVVLGTGLAFGVAIPFVRKKTSLGAVPAALMIGAGAVFAVLKANQLFLHYLHLFVVPATLLLASSWGFALEAMRRRPPRAHQMAAVLVVTLVVPQLVAYAMRGLPHRHYQSWYSQEAPPDEIAEFIRANQGKGEPLEVWGWAPSYYVHSCSKSATRDAIGHAVLGRSAYSDYYLETHLSDLEKSRPKFFVDATGAFHWPDWPPASEIRADVVAPVSDWLLSHYTEVAEYQRDAEFGAIRLYVRKDAASGLTNP